MSSGKGQPVRNSSDVIGRKCVSHGFVHPLPVPRRQAILRVSAMTTCYMYHILVWLRLYNEHSCVCVYIYVRCKQCSKVSMKDLKIEEAEPINEEMIAQGTSGAPPPTPKNLQSHNSTPAEMDLAFISRTEQCRN